MYKSQVKLQKVICLIALCAGAVVFIYALGLLTDLYDMLYNMIPDPDELENTRVAGARIYYDMQPFNKLLLYCGILLILLATGLFVTGTQSRRRYYISNYVATGVNVTCQLAAAAWIGVKVQQFRNIYDTTVDFAQLERRLSRLGTYTESRFWFDVHWFVCGLLVISAALLITNLILKVKLMKAERDLLEQGKAV